MGSDVNADLVGFKYMTGVGTAQAEEVECLGSTSWSDQYVVVRFPTGHTSIKPAGLVRWIKQNGGVQDE